MAFDIHIQELHIHHHHSSEDSDIINQKLDTIMAEQSQLAADLVALKAQVAKIGEEIVAKVAALEAAILAADDVTPEVQAAFDDLKAQVQGLDDLNPDA